MMRLDARHKIQDTSHKTQVTRWKICAIRCTVKILIILGVGVLSLGSVVCFAQETSEYVNKAWAASGEGNFVEVHRITDQCIEQFLSEADTISRTLTDFPPPEKQSVYQVMNDVATCYFIKGVKNAV